MSVSDPIYTTDGLNIPSKPTGDGASAGKSQRSRRYADTFYDNHVHPTKFPQGRPWTGERELAANPDLMHPDGFVTPDLQQGIFVADDLGTVDRRATFLSVWHAPWTPIAKFFKFDYRRKRIRFDYQKGRAEEQDSYNKYYEAAAKFGAELNRQVDYGVIPHFQITAKLGLPTQLVQVYDAAIAGDPWLLGFIDEPNVELAKILGYTSSGIKRPMSYSPHSQPVVTPEQVLQTPNTELLKMIADMSEKMARLQATVDEQQKEQARAAQSQKIKDGMQRAKDATKAGANAA